MEKRNGLLRMLCVALILGAALNTVQAQSAQRKLANNVVRQSGQKATLSLRKALTKLEHKFDVSFVYESKLLKNKYVLQKKELNGNLEAELTELLHPHALRYSKVSTRTYVILDQSDSSVFPQQKLQKGTIRGTVTDANGKPIPGANLILVGTNMGTATGANGSYSFAAEAGDYQLRARVIGYKTQTADITVSAGETVTQNFQLEEDVLNFDEVVVTGTNNPKTKLESSVAITTIPDKQLNEAPPQSTAGVLKSVPGFYVEASGGEGGNNLFARGIPADGSFRYVTVQENGLPVYESPELAFANVDELFRFDETVDRVEAVRGGSASIYASNAPGGIINLVSKTGGSELSGIAKITGGTHGYSRLDFNVGGPFAEESDWRFNVGGFYRYDEGARYAGFPGNRGGQVKANLTRLLEDGYIRVYGKYLNDRNIFYLPVPLTGGENPESIEGFDANWGTMTTAGAASVTMPGRNGEYQQRDLADGIHPVYKSLGAEVLLDLGGGWTLKNSARAMHSELQFNAIFSLSNPMSATDYANGIASDNGAADWRYRYTETGRTISPAQASSLNGNGLVATTGWWYVNKPLSNFSNDFQMTLDVEDHSLTTGFYFSNYTADEFWSFNDILTEVTGRPSLLDLELLDNNGNKMATRVTDNGFLNYGSFYVNANNSGTVAALYANDEWQVTDEMRVDAGFRYERGLFRGQVENPNSVNLDGDPNTLYDNSVPVSSGDFNHYSSDFGEWAASLGLNYSITDKMAVFGRASKGFRMPDFDDLRGGTTGLEVEQVYQLEGGVKISSPTFALFASGFFSRFENLPFNDTVLQNGQLVNLNRFANSETIGLETEAIYSPGDLKLKLTGTLQDPRLRDYSVTTVENGQEVTTVLSGNSVKRIPQLLIEFSPSYNMGNFDIHGQWRFVGDRYSNNANTVTLPSFSVFNAGATYTVNQVEFGLNVTNITNSLGLTEGNPRVDVGASGQQSVYMARPILPRSATLSIGYNF